MNRFNYLITVVFFALSVLASTLLCVAAQQYPSGLSAGAIKDGIYAGNSTGDCCWMTSNATIRLTVPAGVDTFIADVFIPNYAVTQHEQDIRIRFDDGPWQLRCCLGRGMHELAFALAPGNRNRQLSVNFAMSHSFVPAKLGLNADPRRLSVLLRGVELRDTRTGTIYGATQTQSTNPSLDLALLSVAALGILALTLRRPVFGVGALLLSDPFLLAYDTHGTTMTLPKVALVAVALGLIPRLRTMHARAGRSMYLLAAVQVAVIATMIVSSVGAFSHGAAIRETLKAAQYLATLVVAYFAYRLDSDERVIRWSLGAVTIVVAALALLQEFTGAPQGTFIAGHEIARIAGPLEGPNQLAAFLGIVVPAILAFALLRKAMPVERVAIPLGLIACLLTFSRGGIGAMIIALALLFAIRYWPQRRRAIAATAVTLFAAAFVLAVAAFGGLAHGPVMAIFGSVGNDSFNGGLGTRSDLWHGAYMLWRTHPLIGIGPGNYELAISQYDPGVRTHANSMYFNVLAEEGLLGFAALITLLVTSVAAFVRRLEEPLVLGACVVSAALAFHQIVDSLLIYPKAGVIWWVVLAMAAALIDRGRTSEENMSN